MTILYKARYWLLLLTVVLGTFLWPGVQTALQVDNSLTVWFLDDDPALVTYQQFKARFGNDEVVIVMVNDAQGLLNPAYFASFTAVTNALEILPDVAGVIGPGNTNIPTKSPLGMDLIPLLAANTTATDVRNRLAAQPTIREQLFSHDYSTARFLVTLKNRPDFDLRRAEVLDTIKATVEKQLPDKRVFFGGVGIIYAGLNALSQQDFGFFLGVGYLIMVVLLWWIYRKPLLLLYTIGLVALSTYFTLGLYGTCGYRINLMTVLLPIIIVLLGIMDAIHVINERNQLSEAGADNRESALQALAAVFKPCLFTTFTTAAGFLALETSPMAILKNFGLFAAIGIGLCLFFTYLLGVILLPLTQPSRTITTLTGDRLAHLLGRIMAKKSWFQLLSGALVLVFGLGITQLKTDTYTLGYFPDSHPVVQDHRGMEAAWGPYMPLELLVEPRAGQSLFSPAVVQAAVAFSDSAKTLPGVGPVFGFYSLYQSVFEAQFGAKSRNALKSRSALKLANEQLANRSPELARMFIHDPSHTGRVTVSGTMLSARELTGKMDTLMRIADATLGRVASVKPAGYQPMYAGIVNYVAESQVNSLLMSFGLIFVLVWLFIRDVKLAALTVIPNLFPVVVMMGIMGWLGIRLDTATASIGAIVLSFCVDDSIHFIYKYRQNRQAGKRPDLARLATITHVGPAIVLTAFVLFSGYILMIVGSLVTVQLWGLLTAVSIVGALYGELVIFPLVLERFDREA
ncbi:efflux RND transporter permease subunit [Fibrivirga algicola]|uniref:MMPL family transporter n=1 Tax=Fibrivirga algicola TaxID=2950420 RepID=A0ABX0QE18_9BACT|nr:MMPL family transporter [Fibrivirga algicola]NID10227.1 MMPL family transporter [Fibrivirga algicola]